MTEKMRKAEVADVPALLNFYEQVCEAQALSPYSPSWHFGIYPDAEDLEKHVRADESYLTLLEGRIAAAAVMTEGDDPIYADAAWPTTACADEVCVLHLFAVHPDFRRQGISGGMLEALAEQAKAERKRVMRLDVVTGNLPAERLYLRHDFRFVEQREVYYPDTGDISVCLYERVLY